MAILFFVLALIIIFKRANIEIMFLQNQNKR